MNLQEPMEALVPNSEIMTIEKAIELSKAAGVMPFVETTWTPVVRGSTTAGTIALGLVRGLCISIGQYTFIHVHVTINSISGSPTGSLQIRGCPLSPVYETPLTLGITSYTGVDLNQRYLMPIIHANGYIEILSCGSGPEEAVPVSVLAPYATIQLAGSFIATV
ncbi:MAG: hypothetical protein LBB94_09575 [Clostridiales bacterium]|jgi:hypothetical protein|nr:hypothetical protein [Clostridiales bacterium]